MIYRTNNQGYGLLECIMGIALFSLIAVGLAQLVAASYVWYQEALLYHRAIGFMQEAIDCYHKTGILPKEDAHLQFTRKSGAIPDSNLLKGKEDPQLFTVSWLTPRGIKRSFSALALKRQAGT